jgi:hypothetical protein
MMDLTESKEDSMTHARAVTIASVVLVVGAHPLVAQELSRYRGYALESSVAAVIETSGARASDLSTRHARPARIQELEWRAPYVPSGRQMADPVSGVVFSFCDDQLYQIVVTYDKDRTEGLTNDDVIESFSATYGLPLLLTTRTPRGASQASASTDIAVVARWEDAATVVTLTRGTYAPQYQLVLISKTLDARARAAIEEALRLDRQEAPQRELDRQTKEVADVALAGEKARVVNKPAFRP